MKNMRSAYSDICALILLFGLFKVGFPQDSFLHSLYACDPPCQPTQCCVHTWEIGAHAPGRSLDSPLVHLLKSKSNQKRLISSCAPLQSLGSNCEVQHTVELCPCGLGLICQPQQGEFGKYVGTCVDGKQNL